MTEDRLSDRMSEITDRFLQSRFGLWNALLTINGILLSVLSASSLFAKAPPSTTINAVAILCVVSLFLLVFCYISTMQSYYRIGEVLNDEGENLDDTIRKKDINRALWRRKLMLLSERLVLGFNQ